MMSYETYLERYHCIRKNSVAEKVKLAKEFILSNVIYKKGDIIKECSTGNIIVVEKIKVFFDKVNKKINVYYQGERVSKELIPYKNKRRAMIYFKNRIKKIDKPEDLKDNRYKKMKLGYNPEEIKKIKKVIKNEQPTN